MVYINGDVYHGEWYQGDMHGKVELINYHKIWQISCNFLSKISFNVAVPITIKLTRDLNRQIITT